MTSEHPIDELAGEWEELAERTDAAPFLRPGWISAWSGAFAGRPPVAFALRLRGRLAAVVPLEQRWRSLRSPTNWHTPVFGPLADSEDSLSELADAIVARRPRRLEIGFLGAGSLELEALRRAAADGGYRMVQRTLTRSPYVPVEGDWDGYEATLARKRRKEIGRLRRRLADEVGEIGFDVHDGTERLDTLLSRGFELEGSGWKAEQGTAIVSRPETHRFYTEIARWAAERGWLRLFFLRAGGTEVAFDLCLEHGGRLYVVKGGFDTEYSRYGPGTLLEEHCLRWCFARGLRSYELLGDVSAHKAVWTDEVHERVLLQCFPLSPAGLAGYAAYAWGRPLAKRVKDRVSGRA